MKLTFNEYDIAKIQSFFTSNLDADQLNHLIQNHPKIFCKIIREYQQGTLTQRRISAAEGLEEIVFIAQPDTIQMNIIKNKNKNFSLLFQEMIGTISEKVALAQEEIKIRKNLKECGFNKKIIEQINQSLKEDWMNDIQQTTSTYFTEDDG